MYGLVNRTIETRSIDEIESLELLLPAFPDMHIRTLAYRSLLSHLNQSILTLYVPQLLQMIKFDYHDGSLLIEHLLEHSIQDFRLAHQLYWFLRQLLTSDQIHFLRYYHFFLSLLYVLPEEFRCELQNQYELALRLNHVALEMKNLKNNRQTVLMEKLKEINVEFFQSSPPKTCRLPCQFSFITENIDVQSCSVFNSFTTPIKLIFNSIDSFGDKYSTIYKVGDDLRVRK